MHIFDGQEGAFHEYWQKHFGAGADGDVTHSPPEGAYTIARFGLISWRDAHTADHRGIGQGDVVVEPDAVPLDLHFAPAPFIDVMLQHRAARRCHDPTIALARGD